VAAVLNPIYGERREKERNLGALRRQVEVLQEEVSEARGRVSSSEADLQRALNQIRRIEETVAGTSGEGAGPAASASGGSVRKKGRKLTSSLEAPKGLKEYWYPIEFSKDLQAGSSVQIELFDKPWLLSRSEGGAVTCVKAPGSAVEGQADSVPVREKDSCVWAYLGRNPPPEDLPDYTALPESFTEGKDFKLHCEISLDVPVEHGLLIENLLDLAHAPFTHTETFAKGWSIPDLVNFQTLSRLGGNWEPYPIDMSFNPPCVTLSTIGLARPGQVESGLRAGMCPNHLHQMHCCLPAGRGRTRLLYRMSMDFLDWTLYVPGMKKVWRAMADKVLGEDLVLVQGQQDRSGRGGDVWKHPMPYDKIAVRYRRWRNSHEEGAGPAEKEEATADLGRKVSAGELFNVDEQAPGISYEVPQEAPQAR